MMIRIGAFRELQLAEYDGAGGAQLAHHGGVAIRTEGAVDGGPGRGRNALYPAQILHRDWHAVERAPNFASRDLSLGRARLCQCRVGSYQRIALELAVERLDAIQLCL